MIQLRRGAAAIVLSLIGLSSSAAAQAPYHRTFFGGGEYDRVQGVAVDAQDRVYIAGHTTSTNLTSVLPMANAGYDSSSNGDLDAFVAVLDKDLQHVLHWTLIGGDKQDRGYSVEIASNGDVVLVGFTESANFPTTGGPAQAGSFDVFVARFSPDLKVLRNSTVFGGSGEENPRGSFCMDAAGNVYIGGHTQSLDMPTTPNAFQPAHAPVTGVDDWDGFLVKFSSSGQVVWSTYIGGSRNDAAYSGVRLASDGTVFTAGFTNSSDFPVTAGAFQRTFGGNPNPAQSYIGDGFVARFAADGRSLVFSTYLGGVQADGVAANDALELDPAGNPVVIGQTASANFPVTALTFDTTYNSAANGMFDGYVTKLSADGRHLLASTFLGGAQAEEPSGLAIDSSGDVYLSGNTDSPNFPVTADADQTTYSGGGDGFMAKLSADLDLTYSSYIGGNGHTGYGDRGRGLTLTHSGQVLIGGDTDSPNLPVSSAAFATHFAGGKGDGFISIEPLSATYSFGEGKLNSLGLRPKLRAITNPKVSLGTLSMQVSSAVPLATGVLAYGTSVVAKPFRGGTLYMGKPIARMGPNLTLDAAGSAQLAIPMSPAMIGETRVYQFWYRDAANADGTGTGLSSAVKVTFTP